MTYLFDMDGTLTEPWYGKDTPEFYKNMQDMATRSYIGNTYQFVKPLPYINDFLDDIFRYHRENNLGNPKFAVITTIVNGREYIDKVDYLSNHFLEVNNQPIFTKNNIYGVTSNDTKLDIINYIVKQDGVIFFDDTISIINYIKANYDKTHYHCLALHSTSILMRSIEEIIDAFFIENKIERDDTNIDILDIRQAVLKGEIEFTLGDKPWNKNTIYCVDLNATECVKVGEINDVDVEVKEGAF